MESRMKVSQMIYFYLKPLTFFKGFPGGTLGKEPTCHSGDVRDAGSIPGSGRSPGGGHGNLLQYSCLESPIRSIGSQRVGHDLATEQPSSSQCCAETFHCPEHRCLFARRPQSPSPLAAADRFTGPIILPVSECLPVGTMQCLAFSAWPLSLSSMRLCFLHVREKRIPNICDVPVVILFNPIRSVMKWMEFPFLTQNE